MIKGLWFMLPDSQDLKLENFGLYLKMLDSDKTVEIELAFLSSSPIVIWEYEGRPLGFYNVLAIENTTSGQVATFQKVQI